MNSQSPLSLPVDRRPACSLDDWLSRRADGKTDPSLVELLRLIAHAVPPLAARLALGGIAGDAAETVGRNKAGDAQKALDIAAHDHFLDAMRGASVAAILSEEAPEIESFDDAGRFALAMDPIDGSGSIGVGAPLGALFAVFPARDGGAAFRLPGRHVLAAAYVSFGHSTDIGLSFGDCVCHATLDPRDGRFYIIDPHVQLPAQTDMIAYNALNERHWPLGLQRYVAELRSGKDGPRGRDANMRWLAAAVGELHRVLLKGGAFLYPRDRRAGYEEGRLRLLYEAVPIAFLIEAAGGAATDGIRPILDIEPHDPHQKTPLCFGARDEIERIRKHLVTT